MQVSCQTRSNLILSLHIFQFLLITIAISDDNAALQHQHRHPFLGCQIIAHLQIRNS